ncbi:hypothetical protein BDR04DRAFT_1111431 [Suillus decipiens]|nr:hypothetical protein BDR04DRAFT_1111431 [Suillus decipiens]
MASQAQADTTLLSTSCTPTSMPSPPTKPRKGWIRTDDELVSDLRAEDVWGHGER